MEAKKTVFRLLTLEDITRQITGRQIFVYWPEYEQWYRAKIKKFDAQTQLATIVYPDTEEEENDADLKALIAAKELAFKEQRPMSHVCGEDEREDPNVFVPPEQKQRKRGRPSSSRGDERPQGAAAEEEDYSEDSSDGERAAPEDSDPSFNSADDDEEGQRKKRGRGESGADSGGSKRLQQRGEKRQQRAAAAQRRRWEELAQGGDDEDEVEARRLLAHASRPTSAKKQGGGGGGGAASPGSNDAAVRSKVRSSFEQVLQLATDEATGADPAAELPAPALLATGIEDELLRLFGGTTKEYKTKYRTLHFNLKEPVNTELRAHVIRGDITPAAFVRMTANELASKELAEYRAKKQEEALKMSVLDAEAAAKFSTAAALDARDTLALPAAIVTGKLLAARESSPVRSPPPDVPKTDWGAEAPYSGGGSAGAASPRAPIATSVEGGAEAARGGRSEPPPPPFGAAVATGPSPAAAIDWASVKALAVQASHNSVPVSSLSADAAAALEPFGSALSIELSGSGATGGGVAAVEPSAAPESPLLDPIGGLSGVFLPAPDPATLVPNVWQGSMVVPTVGECRMEADAVAGSGDLGALLGGPQLNVRGRLALTKLEHFLSELHLSKHRLAMLGVLRPPAGADLAAAVALAGGYLTQGRAGVAEPHRGVEVYLVPSGELALRLLQAAKEADAMAAAAVAAVQRTPSGELPVDHMVIMVVYKKDARVPPRAPPGMGPQQQPQAVPALPTGLDLSAISALAAAFLVPPMNPPGP